MSSVRAILTTLLVAVLLAGSYAGVKPAEAGEKPRRLSPATRKALVKAQEGLKKEQYPQARQVLASYLKDHAEQAPADIYWLLGNTYFLEDRLDKACTAYQKGLDRYPDNASLLQNYAIASYLNQDFKAAGDYFVQAYEKITENPDIKLLYKAGSAYYNAKNFEKARQTLERLLGTAEAVAPEWRKLLVYTHVSLENWDAAEKALDPLMRREPESAANWKLLSNLHMKRDSYRKAASALRIAYAIDAPEPSAWSHLADIYFYLNAPLKASQCIVKGYGSDLSPAQYDKLARAYSRTLRYGRAIHYIDEAIKKEPTAERYKARGRFFHKNRQYQKALASFEKAVQLDPEDEWSRLMIGFCAMELSRWELAHSAFSGASDSDEYGGWAKSALAMVENLIDAKKAAQGGGKGSSSSS